MPVSFGVTGVFSGAQSNPNQDAITRKGSIRNTFTCQRPFGKGRSRAEREEKRGYLRLRFSRN